MSIDRVRVRAFAPGRVNLIGDHTDYAGGLAMPMAIDLGITVEGRRGGERIELRSTSAREPVSLPLVVDDPSSVSPSWGRYVAGVVHEITPTVGLVGTIDSTLPAGSGLSSSAALELAVALALGFDGSPLALAEACQRAEQVASGVPCGLMDQLTSAAGIDGHALLIDFTTLEVIAVPVPPEAAIVVIHSGQPRALADSAYGERRATTEAATAIIGPLHDASLADLDRIDDRLIRRRARHVLSENDRVRTFAAAFARGDLAAAGAAMTASHTSLRDDFEVSTTVLDALVERLVATPGVYGARLTGAGFGGCVVALADPGVLDEGWTVHANGGAYVQVVDD